MRNWLAFTGELIVAPTGAFSRLSPASHWIPPPLFAVVLAAAVHAASVPFTVALVQRLSVSASADALAGLERWLLRIAVVRGGWVAVKAGFICWVLWLTINLKGESVRARLLMMIAAYASVAFVAEDALRLCVSWLRGIEQIRGPQDLQSFTGLDAFIPTRDMGLVGRLALAQISLFSLWFVTILRGGLVGLGGIRSRSATVTAVLCWGYLFVLQMGMAFVVSSVQAPGQASN
ncbi:MAG: hypothetical protein H0V12_05765 [Chloroflexi bacterium]|nr:hypothetical protein [Chloroflexota bacterium]